MNSNQSEFDLKKHCSIMQTKSYKIYWKYILISFKESLHDNFSFCQQFVILSTTNIFCLQFFYDFFFKKHAIIILQFSQVQVTENIFLLCQCWFELKTCN